ncbi:hypothetical protein V499_06897 [Pseudogymnoascus sp. VKM F-103]|nr:hypothetical protein V499_06897 [Pseudogymnoascus sp. VKM F-103]
MHKYVVSPEQVAQYNSDGYLLIRAGEHNLVTGEELQAWSKEVQSWPREKGKWMPYDEINENGERQLMRTENFVDYHPKFKALLCGENLRGVIAQLTRGEMLLFKDKINYKSGFGNGFLAHLDAPAYDHIGEIEHTTANLAVNAATPENGCLQVVPGSHRMKVDFIHAGRIHPDWENSHEWVLVPLEAGDIVFFGSHLAHRSFANQTPESRTMVYATYHSAADGPDLREKYYIDRRVVFPPDHERVAGEDYEVGWKRYGFAAPFSKQDAVAQESEVMV